MNGMRIDSTRAMTVRYLFGFVLIALLGLAGYLVLLDGLNKIVQMAPADQTLERERVLWIESGIFGGILLTLLAEIFLVFRPMVNLIVAENKQLTASERRLTAVFNTVSEAIFSTDEEGRILSVNDEAVRLWDYQADALIGRSLDSLFVEPGFFEQARKYYINPTTVTYVEADAVSCQGRRFSRDRVCSRTPVCGMRSALGEWPSWML